MLRLHDGWPQCWRPALVAARVLLVRSPDAQFCPQIPLGKVRAPKKMYPLRGQREWRLSAQETFSRGGARKKTAGECKKCELAHLYSSLCLVSPWLRSGELWPEACTVNVCAVPVRSPIHTLTPSLVAWQEERELARRAA